VVVDLPDLVGHPAFPTTMEALVSGNGGTVLDAARAALDRDEADNFVVPGARLLAPVLPASLRSTGASDLVRPVASPGDEIAWPAGAGWLDYEPKIVAVLGRSAHEVDPDDAGRVVFGYTLVSDFAARDANGDPTPDPRGIPLAIGPCLATADEVDPQAMTVTVRVDGEEWVKGNLNGVAGNLLSAIAQASRYEELRPGDAFASSPYGGFEGKLEQRIWPGAEVELVAEGIGVLANRLGRP
jgi:2-keto-4-pentenoate hydratase/2-oxohepta-3-ene-1,7-dioic acid hydratase in catechol pathway